MTYTAVDVLPKPPQGAGLTVGVILHWLPGHAHIDVRGGGPGLLQRLADTARRKLDPHVPQTYVRGVGVSMDSLLECILSVSRAERFLFVADAEVYDAAITWIAGNADLHHRKAVLMSWQQVTQGALDGDAGPDVWFDPCGEMPTLARMRDRFSSRVFPIVSVQHGFSVHDLLWQHFTRLLLTKGYNCDSFVCTTAQSQGASERLLSNLADNFNEDFGTHLRFPQRTDRIPLCVDTDTFIPLEKRPLRKTLGLPGDSIVLLYLGYVSALKADLLPLLSVFRTLANNNPSERLLLIIAGTGPEIAFEALMANARALGIQKHMLIKRDISDEHKRQLMSAADIFVSPGDSIQESFGLAPIEAMACGIPQVVSEWDGYRDTVVDRETGFLVPTIWGDCSDEYYGTGELLGWEYDHLALGQSLAIDLGSMTDRLQQLITNRTLRESMGRASRARAVACFSYETVVRKYDGLFLELSEIANRTARCAVVSPFDQPAYFKVYRDYATKAIHEDDAMVVEPDAIYNRVDVTRMWSGGLGDVPGVRLLENVLADELLAVIKEHPEPPITVKEILKSMAEKGRSSSCVLRHILWLLKYGRVRLASHS